MGGEVGGFQGIRAEVIWALTVQKDRGRKKILTNAKSLTFSPSLVDALLSITALALNSCEKEREKKANISHLRQRAKHKQTRKNERKTYGIPQSFCGRQFPPEILALIL